MTKRVRDVSNPLETDRVILAVTSFLNVFDMLKYECVSSRHRDIVSAMGYTMRADDEEIR